MRGLEGLYKETQPRFDGRIEERDNCLYISRRREAAIRDDIRLVARQGAGTLVYK